MGSYPPWIVQHSLLAPGMDAEWWTSMRCSWIGWIGALAVMASACEIYVGPECAGDGEECTGARAGVDVGAEDGTGDDRVESVGAVDLEAQASWEWSAFLDVSLSWREAQPTAEAPALDDQVRLRLLDTSVGERSSFTIRLSSAGVLDGEYEGWCVDADHYISRGRDYSASLYWTYEKIPVGVVEKPQNFDVVNYLVNTYQAGAQIALGNVWDGSYRVETVTKDDLQIAIWTLIDDSFGPVEGPWSQARVDAMVHASLELGGAFVPGCGDLVAGLVVPDENLDVVWGNEVQSVVVAVPVPWTACS